jgi:hypothetical protein
MIVLGAKRIARTLNPNYALEKWKGVLAKTSYIKEITPQESTIFYLSIYGKKHIHSQKLTTNN